MTLKKWFILALIVILGIFIWKLGFIFEREYALSGLEGVKQNYPVIANASMYETIDTITRTSKIAADAAVTTFTDSYYFYFIIFLGLYLFYTYKIKYLEHPPSSGHQFIRSNDYEKEKKRETELALGKLSKELEKPQNEWIYNRLEEKPLTEAQQAQIKQLEEKEQELYGQE